MRIFFYAPLKPLDHPQPSGDLVIAMGLQDFLVKQGHTVKIASSLRCRWIYWKPWLWFPLFKERWRLERSLDRFRPHLWLTYHSYYKAPDLLGPAVCRRACLPYVIFEGSYATKYKRDWRTRPGFVLHQKALSAAHHVVSNQRQDILNLERLLPPERLTYVAPGIYPADFSFDGKARSELRRTWNVEEAPVILSAAMFRPDVKTQGLIWLIRACGELYRQGKRFYLVIAGDGKEKSRLKQLAQMQLPERTLFVGKVPRNEMYRFYSAGDIFAFPGIRESLGMVYLEAQSCGLPVVAFANGGIPEVVKDQVTGFLVPPFALEPYVHALDILVSDPECRKKMGNAGQQYIRKDHDLDMNYQSLEVVLHRVVSENDMNCSAGKAVQVG
jgi:glycosyltransferase involved in cell wall biosynthesis